MRTSTEVDSVANSWLETSVEAHAIRLRSLREATEVVDQAERRAIRRAFEAGVSVTRLAELSGISPESIERLVREPLVA
jgi:hypothetical protein